MDTQYSRIELLALLKTYNKANNDKIKNTDKMKKEELVNLCQSLSLISNGLDDKTHVKDIDLRNISKNSILQDISLYFMKKGKAVPSDISNMKRQQLIDYMEMHNITHYTPELIEKEIKKYMEDDNAKKIIYYNMIRYDNVNTEDIQSERILEYVQSRELDTEMKNFNDYAKLLRTIYLAYDKFCEATSHEIQKDRIKSFPKIIQHLKKITEK